MLYFRLGKKRAMHELCIGLREIGCLPCAVIYTRIVVGLVLYQVPVQLYSTTCLSQFNSKLHQHMLERKKGFLVRSDYMIQSSQLRNSWLTHWEDHDDRVLGMAICDSSVGNVMLS